MPGRLKFTRAQWLIAGAVLSAMAVMAGVLYFVDPEECVWLYPQCGSYRYFGLYCPGCGITRSLHALLHGDVVRALSMNLLVGAVAPVAVLAGVRPRWVFNYKFLTGAVIFLIIYGVLRNIYPVLAPG